MSTRILLVSALFLLDTGNKFWLWQGFWPESGDAEDNSNLVTGSGMIRWHAERRAAMQTTVDYRRLRTRSAPAELVWAGHEPVEFINLFPCWKIREDAKDANTKVHFPRMMS